MGGSAWVAKEVKIAANDKELEEMRKAEAEKVRRALWGGGGLALDVGVGAGAVPS